MKELLVRYGADSHACPLLEPVKIIYENAFSGVRDSYEFVPPKRYESLVAVLCLEANTSASMAYKRYCRYLEMPATERTNFVKNELMTLVENSHILLERPSEVANKIIRFTEMLICASVQRVGLLKQPIAIGSQSTYADYFSAFKNIINQIGRSPNFLNSVTLRLDAEKVQDLIVGRKQPQLLNDSEGTAGVVKCHSINKQKLAAYNSCLYQISLLLPQNIAHDWFCSPGELEMHIRNVHNTDEYMASFLEPLQKKRKAQAEVSRDMPWVYDSGEHQKLIAAFGRHLCSLRPPQRSISMRLSLIVQVVAGARFRETTNLMLDDMAVYEGGALKVSFTDHKTYNKTQKQKTIFLVREHYTSDFSYSWLLGLQVLPHLKYSMTKEDLESLRLMKLLNPESKNRGYYPAYYRVFQSVIADDPSIHPYLKKYLDLDHQLKTHIFRKVTNACLSQAFGPSAAATYIQWEHEDNSPKIQKKHYDTFVQDMDKLLFSRCSDRLVNEEIPQIFGLRSANPYLSKPISKEILENLICFPFGFNTKLKEVIWLIVQYFIQHLACKEWGERQYYLLNYVKDDQLRELLTHAVVRHRLESDMGREEGRGKVKLEREA